jgi:hypothetical protein
MSAAARAAPTSMTRVDTTVLAVGPGAGQLAGQPADQVATWVVKR